MIWPEKVSQLRALAGILHGSRAFGGPYQASFSLTNRCNLRCIHCYFYSPLAERPNFFEVRDARRKHAELPDTALLHQQQHLDADTAVTAGLIDELLAMGTRRFHFSGSGEPFLQPGILDLFGRAKRAGAWCVSNTNGTLLTRATIDELVRLGVDELRITPMAGTDAVYRATHPGCPPATFQRLKESLLYLAERKAAARSTRPNVALVFVIIRQNYQALHDFAEFAGAVHADRVTLQPMDDVEDPGLASVVLTGEQTESLRKDLPSVARQLDSYDITHNCSHFSMVFDRGLGTTALYRVIPCYAGWTWTRFTADGMVHPCHRCYEPLGNIHEQKFADIWNSAAYRRFRREARAIHQRGASVTGCVCDRCCHYVGNLRVYRSLHPLKGRSVRIPQMAPAGAPEDEA